MEDYIVVVVGVVVVVVVISSSLQCPLAFIEID